MLRRDRERYHQLHPTKLCRLAYSDCRRHPLRWPLPLGAAVVGFGRSIAVTIVILSGRFDCTLSKGFETGLSLERSPPAGRQVSMHSDFWVWPCPGLAVGFIRPGSSRLECSSSVQRGGSPADTVFGRALMPGCSPAVERIHNGTPSSFEEFERAWRSPSVGGRSEIVRFRWCRQSADVLRLPAL
jgi:hypothetical protein